MKTGEKIVHCPNCGEEICIQITVEGDFIFVHQEQKYPNDRD